MRVSLTRLSRIATYVLADLVRDGVLAMERMTYVLSVRHELRVLHGTNPCTGHGSKVTATREELSTEDVGSMSRVNTLMNLEQIYKHFS